MSCLESNNLLSNTQHGFRADLSTTTALTKISNRVSENTDNKKFLYSRYVICTNLSKVSVIKFQLEKCITRGLTRFGLKNTYHTEHYLSVSEVTNLLYYIFIFGCLRDLFSDQFYSLYMQCGVHTQWLRVAAALISVPLALGACGG